MTFFGPFSAVTITILLVAMMSAPSNGQNCTVETAALNASPNLTVADAQLSNAILSQVTTCVENKGASCSVDVSTQVANVESVCIAEGGQTYEPVLEVYCTNSNSGLATIVNVMYAACLGESCTTEDFQDGVNTDITNATNAINEVLNPDGINCRATFSGACNFLGRAAFLMMGSIAVIVSFV